jgi:hypothetical protein
VVVNVVAPSYPKNFRSFCRSRYGLVLGGTWDINDTGVTTRHAAQDPAFWWFNEEDIQQRMVPHETGHLLGLDHTGLALQVGSCVHLGPGCSKEEVGRNQYGSHKSVPMWVARDIMSMGEVVHACNALPWMSVMKHHVRRDLLWLPAGTRIPPRAIKDIPQGQPSLANSPYQGGFQEKGR